MSKVIDRIYAEAAARAEARMPRETGSLAVLAYKGVDVKTVIKDMTVIRVPIYRIAERWQALKVAGFEAEYSTRVAYHTLYNGCTFDDCCLQHDSYYHPEEWGTVYTTASHTQAKKVWAQEYLRDWDFHSNSSRKVPAQKRGRPKLPPRELHFLDQLPKYGSNGPIDRSIVGPRWRP